MASPRALLLPLALVTACAPAAEPEPDRPNILLVVWDTARRDRIGLYGADRTTPGLDELATSGLVFDDCRSVAPSTVPSHGSMFTGLFPSEHGADHSNRWLPGANDTIAELLSGAGYDTYLFSSNPNISDMENFGQGFRTEEHLWDEAWRERAIGIMADRLTTPDGAVVGGEAGRADRVRRADIADFEIKGCGELISEGFLGWLDDGVAEDAPWFACLNYMEAHYPLQPELEYRERFLSGPDLAASYTMDRSERRLWRHVLGAEQLSAEEERILGLVYDAAIAELDALFVDLWRQLEARGELEDTLVVLVSDHGEHLGEHDLFDHRYSLYDELVRLPLVLWWPDRVEAGRTDRPVTNQDLFLTFLEAADLGPPPALHARLDDPLLAPWAGASLLDPTALPAERARFAHYLNDFGVISTVLGPGEGPLDETRFRRELRSLVRGDEKLLFQHGPRRGARVFDLAADATESTGHPVQDGPLLDELEAWATSLDEAPPSDKGGLDPRAAAEQEARLGAIGYGGDDE